MEKERVNPMKPIFAAGDAHTIALEGGYEVQIKDLGPAKAVLYYGPIDANEWHAVWTYYAPDEKRGGYVWRVNAEGVKEQARLGRRLGNTWLWSPSDGRLSELLYKQWGRTGKQ